MLIDLLKGNECKPIVTQDITLREIRDNILKHHDYCCHSNRKRQDDLGDADSGIDIPCKSLKWKALLSHSIKILTFDFACLIVKLSKFMLLTASDLLVKMTTKNVHNPFRRRTRV